LFLIKRGSTLSCLTQLPWLRTWYRGGESDFEDEEDLTEVKQLRAALKRDLAVSKEKDTMSWLELDSFLKRELQAVATKFLEPGALAELPKRRSEIALFLSQHAIPRKECLVCVRDSKPANKRKRKANQQPNIEENVLAQESQRLGGRPKVTNSQQVLYDAWISEGHHPSTKLWDQAGTEVAMRQAKGDGRNKRVLVDGAWISPGHNFFY
jgi:hypothetical protein